MERHEGDSRMLTIFIAVGNEGSVIKELREGLASAFRLPSGVDQFLEVFDASFSFDRPFCLEHGQISRTIQDISEKFAQGSGSVIFHQWTHDGCEAFQRFSQTRGQRSLGKLVFNDFPKVQPQLLGGSVQQARVEAPMPRAGTLMIRRKAALSFG